jgi:hypothetical protein
MWLTGLIEQGTYTDSLPALTEAEYAQLEAGVRKNLQTQLNHRPIHVPKAVNPFSTSPAALHLFERFLQVRMNNGEIPYGYNFSSEDGSSWIEIEVIKVANKDVEIPLVAEVWKMRAVAWVLSLETMGYTMLKVDEEGLNV